MHWLLLFQIAVTAVFVVLSARALRAAYYAPRTWLKLGHIACVLAYGALIYFVWRLPVSTFIPLSLSVVFGLAGGRCAYIAVGTWREKRRWRASWHALRALLFALIAIGVWGVPWEAYGSTIREKWERVWHTERGEEPAPEPPRSTPWPDSLKLLRAQMRSDSIANAKEDSLAREAEKERLAKLARDDSLARLGAKKPPPRPISQIAAASTTGTSRVWNRPGSSPYAGSLEEACRKATVAINGFDLPEQVKKRFLARVGNCTVPDAIVYLTPNTPLRQMWSGPNRTTRADHLMQKDRVGELPVDTLQGRAVRETYASFKTYLWEEEWEGTIHKLYLPLICYNWAWGKAASSCIILEFNAQCEDAEITWRLANKTGQLRPSQCHAMREGDGEWEAWGGKCPGCPEATRIFRYYLGDSVKVQQAFRNTERNGSQGLRFDPQDLETGAVLLCQKCGGRQSCGLILLPGYGPDSTYWNGRSYIRIWDAQWKWGNCRE